MSYQVIARKWRPQTFEEVTGQEPITHALRNAIELERLHHAYLFSGARGVGKTTTARLLAKALNCHKTQKPNPSPCKPDEKNACVSCCEIAEGRSIDVQEIDAASNTGVQNVRDSIIDTINIRAARDRYKIFIIDEVHQLSKQAFDALLKTLEEPPPNVVFILATTELHKVPDTILSRCQEFLFRTIPSIKIYERLKLIADAEKVNVADDALREIARSGEGSMRDAQSNFDQVISFSGAKITTNDVVAALGLASSEILRKTISSIASRNAKEVLAVVEELVNRGQDLRAFCRDFLAFIRELWITKISEQSDGLAEFSIVPFDEMREMGADFSESDLFRFFNLIAETETKLRNANEPRYVLEIGLMKMVEARRLVSLETILNRLSALENSAGATSQIDRPTQKPESSAASVSYKDTAEKKTLNSENAAGLVRKETPSPQLATEQTRNFSNSDSAQIAEKVPSFTQNADFFMPHRNISSDELLHVDDNYLDFAYEERLRREDDDLRLIHGADDIVGKYLAESEPNPRATESVKRAAAGVISSELSGFFKQSDPLEFDSVSTPSLPKDTSDVELLKYAEEHPKIQMIKKILRARIVGATRTDAPEAK